MLQTTEIQTAGGGKLRNYEALREKPAYQRDIYSELKRIEERGKRKKQIKKTRFFGFPRPARS